MPYSRFFADPMVADADFDDSLYCQTSFGQAYPIDSYTTSPDQPLEAFLDYACFQQPYPSVEYPAGWDYQLADYSTPPLDQFGFNLDMSSASNTRLYSASPLGSDCITALASPPLSPPPFECEFTNAATSPDEEPAPRPAPRKRGRPKLNRNLCAAKPAPSTTCTTSPSRQHGRTPRQPHNEVERKYRLGLNSDMGKLRRAVPTLSQSEDGAAIGRPNPSKAMVLSCAVEYIVKIELERDRLREGNERLGGTMWRR